MVLQVFLLIQMSDLETVSGRSKTSGAALRALIDEEQLGHLREITQVTLIISVTDSDLRTRTTLVNLIVYYITSDDSSTFQLQPTSLSMSEIESLLEKIHQVRLHFLVFYRY